MRTVYQNGNAAQVMYQFGAFTAMQRANSIAAMRGIHHIRRQNLRTLLERKYKGNRRALLDDLKITQANFLSRLLSDRPKSVKNIGSNLARRIEAAAGKPENWLDTDHSRTLGKGPDLNYELARRVKILAWREIPGHLISAVEKTNKEERDLVPCLMACSSRTFALRVSGASMEPRFRENDLIFCDPEVKPRSCSFVIVQLDRKSDPVLRQLIFEGDRRYLKAVNPQWPNPIEPLGDNAIICATVILRAEEL